MVDQHKFRGGLFSGGRDNGCLQSITESDRFDDHTYVKMADTIRSLCCIMQPPVLQAHSFCERIGVFPTNSFVATFEKEKRMPSGCDDVNHPVARNE